MSSRRLLPLLRARPPPPPPPPPPPLPPLPPHAACALQVLCCPTAPAPAAPPRLSGPQLRPAGQRGYPQGTRPSTSCTRSSLHLTIPTEHRSNCPRPGRQTRSDHWPRRRCACSPPLPQAPSVSRSQKSAGQSKARVSFVYSPDQTLSHSRSSLAPHKV
jgi:hypothetical protein